VTEATAQLLSRSCTTGWVDWVRGELWLLPDGLARISLGWSRTRTEAKNRKKRGGGSTVPETTVETRTLDYDELDRIVNADRRNRWIPRDGLSKARLREGFLNSCLRIELLDGSHVKLLWLKSDPAFESVRREIGGWLGDNLEIR
jgi:hypothetical protein